MMYKKQLMSIKKIKKINIICFVCTFILKIGPIVSVEKNNTLSGASEEIQEEIEVSIWKK